MISKSEYLKAKKIVDKYEKQAKKPIVIKKPVISHDERRLIKAKKIYKVGTKITSIFGADDVICQPPSYFGEKVDYLYIGEHHAILAHCKSGNSRLIYDNGTWAKIID